MEQPFLNDTASFMNDTASFWLRQALQNTHILAGMMRRGAVPTLPQHPEMTPHMLRRLADDIEALAPKTLETK